MMLGKTITDFWGNSSNKNPGGGGDKKSDPPGKKGGGGGKSNGGAPAWKNKWLQKKVAKANKGNAQTQMDELEELIETKGPRIISERLYDFVNVPKFPQYRILIPKELDRGVRPKMVPMGHPDFKSSSHRERGDQQNPGANNPFASDHSEDRMHSQERRGMTSSQIDPENMGDDGTEPQEGQKKKLSLKGMNEKMKEITREQESKFKQSQAIQSSPMGTGFPSPQATPSKQGHNNNSLLPPLSPLDHLASKRGVSMLGYEGNSSGSFMGVLRNDFLMKLVNKNKRLSFEEDYTKVVRAIKEGSRTHESIVLDEGRKSTSTAVEINGIKFYFPFEPYKQQVTYISNLLESLNKCSNSMIECAPGTGKTLAYLVGSLGWLRYRQSKGDNLSTKIILAVKNYDKMAAAIKQLNMSCYLPRVCTLASRDKLCSNHENVRYMGWDKNCQCMSMLNESVCKYYHGFMNDREKLKDRQNKGYTFDIEDFKTLAAETTSCAYYTSRANLQDSHLVIIPYYYLTKRELREEINEYIHNSVVIVDDAHSIFNSAEEGVSSRFTEQDSYYLHKELNYFRTFLKRLHQATSKGDKRTGEVIKLLDVVDPPVRGFKNFMKKRYPRPETSKDDIFNGVDLFEIAEEMLKPGAVDMLISKTGGSEASREQIVKELLRQSDAVNQILEHVHLDKGSATRFAYLYKWAVLLKRMWELLSDFNSVTKQKGANEAWMHQKLSHYLVVFDDRMRTVPNQPNPAINLRPMSPHLCFQQIQDLSPRSIVLTSGWLSPMDKFFGMTQLHFEHTATIEPIIKVSNQFYLGLLFKFQEDVAANVDYNSRNNEVVVEKLGQALIQIFEIAPRSVIVYFTSHTLMNAYIDKWKRSRIYEKMERFKRITVEPAYNIKNKAIINTFKGQSQHGVGGALFAMFTGKLSDHGDLNDDLTRCVVMVGVPFPHKQDAVVNARKTYYDKFYQSSPELPYQGGPTKKRLNGIEWCNMYTARAISEALMPMIKDKYHYGAAIMLDERYSWPYNQSGISSWMRPVLNQCNSTPELMEQLTTFFADTKVMYQSQKKEIEAHAKLVAHAAEHILPYGGGRKAVNKERQRKYLEQQANGELPAGNTKRYNQDEYSFEGEDVPEYGDDDYQGNGMEHNQQGDAGHKGHDHSDQPAMEDGIVKRRTGWEDQDAPQTKNRHSKVVDESRERHRRYDRDERVDRDRDRERDRDPDRDRYRRDAPSKDHRSQDRDRSHGHKSRSDKPVLGYKGQDLGKLKSATGKLSRLRKPADDSDDSDDVKIQAPKHQQKEQNKVEKPVQVVSIEKKKTPMDIEELSDGEVLLAEIPTDVQLTKAIAAIKRSEELQRKQSESVEVKGKSGVPSSSKDRTRAAEKRASQDKGTSDDSDQLILKASSYLKAIESRTKEPVCSCCKHRSSTLFKLLCDHILCSHCAKESEDPQKHTTTCPRCAHTMKTVQLKLI